MRRLFLMTIFLSSVLAVAGLVWFNATTPRTVRTRMQPTAPRSEMSLPKETLVRAPDFQRIEQVIIPDNVITDYEAYDFVQAVVQAGASVFVLISEDFPEANFSPDWLASLPIPSGVREKIFVSAVRHESPWLRDYGPHFFRSAAQPSAPLVVSFNHNQVQGLDADVNKELAEFLGLKFFTSSAYMEGGDFFSDGENCFISRPLNEPEERVLQTQLAGKLGCKTVTVFDEVPHPHLDMWSMVVDRQTVVVGEIEASSLAFIERRDGAIARDYLDLKKVLDDNAKIYAENMKVVRIPMPLPFRGTLRTYTNALMVNGHIIVPSYKTYGWNNADAYPDEKLLPSYEKKVQAVYEKLGFKVTFVNADRPIYNGGAWHCLAVGVPDFNPRIANK